MTATEAFALIEDGPSTTADKYDNPLPGQPVETRLPGCLFAPASSDEPVSVGRAAVITRDTLYIEASPVARRIKAADRLKRLTTGDVYTVEGEPAVWGRAGIVVALQKVEG